MMNFDPVPQRSSSFLNGYFYDEPGSIPGTLRIQRDAALPKLVLFDYNASHLEQVELIHPEDCASYLDSHSVSWVDVQGLGSEEVLQRLGEVFNLHPLALEDIVNVCNSITPETYSQMLPYVQENYERSIKYAKFRETLRDEVIEFVKNS
jgi:magnesium transporter